MSARAWPVLLAVLSVSVAICLSARKEFSINEVCENLTNYYNLIDPLVHYEIELNFKNQNSYLQGIGHVGFTPQFSVTDCNTSKWGSKIFITATIKDKITIMFKSSPWVQLDNGQLKIKIKLEDNGVLRKIKLASVDVEFSRATFGDQNLGYGAMNSIKSVLKKAFKEAYGRPYEVSTNFKVSDAAAKSAFNGAFHYYMYRLKK